MKRIRVILLTLVLSISMLAPEFSMFPAAFAEDGAQAIATAESAAAAAGYAGNSTGGEDASAAQTQDASALTEEPASGSSRASAAQTEDESAQAEEDASGDLTDTSAAGSRTAPMAAPEEVAKPAALPSSYDKIYMTDLDTEGSLVISAGMKEKLDISRPEYGNGLVLKGKVADLNSTSVDLNFDFNFSAGSVGRLSFDGLKDKDKGMSVFVGVYLDGSTTPVTEFPLKKQMGKREWTNDGEKSVSLGEAGISGKHRVSLRFRIEGRDESKKTSIMIRSLQFCKTTVPVMYFNIDETEGTVDAMNNSSDHSVECYGSVDLIVPDAFNKDTTFRDEYAEQESLKDIDLEYIRGRGNSTWTADKKPYKVKFDDAQDLFGFGANKHWTLLADRFDNSLVRNRMTYHLGRALGMKFTPECVPVEVVMNGEYYGSYLLCEQVRVGKGRITIDDLDKEKDIPAITDKLVQTGGYLLSMDYEEDEKRTFSTNKGVQFYIESPDENVAYFSEYIKAFTQKVEDAIFSPDFKDASGHSYTEYLDLDSAVDYWWIQEFSENGDAYGSGSTYLYKERDPSEKELGKLYWGPLWDFDYVAWGDLDYGSEPLESLECTNMLWFSEMKGDPQFISKVKSRWSKKGGLKENIKAITDKGGLLDKYKKQMETVYNYDHEKWGANESEITEYSGEIEQLRTWIKRRTEYVDVAVAELNVEDHTVKFVVNGKVIKKTTAHGYLRNVPEAPKKKNLMFAGWMSEDNIYYEEGDSVTSDLVLTAVYMTKEELNKSVKIFFRNKDVYYGTDLSGYDDEGYFPDYCVMPDDSYPDIEWISSNEEVAELTDEGYFRIKSFGDTKITARLKNGISKSFKLHIVPYSDMKDYEGFKINKKSMTLKVGKWAQVVATAYPQPCWDGDWLYLSTNELVATVNDMGVVTAIGEGTADILAVNAATREMKKCKVTVTPEKILGMKVKYKGSTYKITSTKKGSRKAMLVKAKNAKSVVVPAYITLYGKKYSVTRIKSKAFKSSKTSELIIKTKKLKKSSVRGALRGSKIKMVKVLLGKKTLNKRYIKKYKKIFTKKNAGRAVKII